MNYEYLTIINDQVELILYLIFSVVIVILGYKMYVKEKDKPKVANVRFNAEIKEDSSIFYMGMISSILILLISIVSNNIIVVCISLSMLIIIGLDKLTDKANELILNDHDLVIIRRNAVYTKISINELEKVIFRKRSIEFYTNKLKGEISFENRERDKKGLIKILKNREISIFDQKA